ncbi:hypothetical protein O181_125582 [Austropuccinia psidii MF-1]|uniref:Uncharacterized protein n=1 Tax=Austropuccinia psidii MF-1 TaxID=1389203 RepID=A0A9Q3KRS8_9BASI|nr:hypothetical protein [Austropuccinia psidii MF-1]
MDLPHSSYPDSLEELWDEEEEPKEIETVRKVVPSSNHQYLDVFSKVKAEKLPPQYTCDHHIELEGSQLFIKPRFRYTQGLHLRDCGERSHMAKFFFNRSTCPLCRKEVWWPLFVC